MKLKVLVSMLMAAGVIAMPSVATADAKDLSSCCAPGDKDYPTHSGSLGNQGYSALTQINQDNVKKLGPVWRTHVSAAPSTTPQPAPGTAHAGQQTTPIVVDGVIYLDTPSGSVIAVDGATGATRWKWTPTAFATNGTRRGVSAGDGKVYTLADGNRVVALDKNSGEERWVVQPTGPGGASLGNID